MNAERLLALYEKVADAPDAVSRLRRFVLDLAVRGKLVEQDPTDEPASELLKRIAAEKARLVKAGEIKRPKPVDPVAIGDMAFPPPPGWTWTRLADIAICLDYMRKPINGTERDQRIEGKSEHELFPYYGATQQQGWIDDYIFDEELVLLGEDGVPFFDPYRSKAYIISGKTWVNNHAHVFKGILISHPFLAHYLNVFDYTGRVVGATRSKLNQARAVDIPVPLPPLAEQRRIVTKVQELMALLDRLEAARIAREDTRDRLTAASLARLTAPDSDPADFPANARFSLATLPALTTRPDQIKPLRQTILNLAIRGKLEEQVPTDGSGAELLTKILAVPWEKKRKAIDLEPDEAPMATAFPLPPNWTWATVQALTRTNQTVTYGILKPEWVDEGVLTVRVTEMKTGEIDVSALPRCRPERASKFAKTTLEPGDLLVSKDGTIGKTAFVPPELAGGNITQHVLRFPICEHVDRHFIRLAIDAPFCQSWMDGETKGVALQGVNVGDFRRMPIPLPPLAEQHRIVAKVDALMALCDRLEAALTTTDTTRARLLEALLHEALDLAAGAVTEAAE